MSRFTYCCAACGGIGPFSTNQKAKGAGRRCNACVHGNGGYECDSCGQRFRDENALRQHAVTHQERNFGCPGCGKMYRGLTDTAKHFESGGCSACRGAENARRAAYQLVAGQQHSSKFLANPLMLTNGGSRDGGYDEDGPNYRCPACSKTFRLLSGLMQHTANRAECAARGEHPNIKLLGGPPASTPQQHRFYHGTTWSNAVAIQRDGFLPSSSGCLGYGIYVAREDKAHRFAELRARETGGYGGLVELLVTIRNPKYVLSDDKYWQLEGYDACRAERTSASTNMEWCILRPSQIKVIRVHQV